MGDEPEKRAAEREDEDRELEREIRSRRKFTLAEAIGRLGGDLLKGASPVTRKRQAELMLEQYLERHLVDGEEALRKVLRRRVTEGEAMLETGYEFPLEALAGYLKQTLESPSQLNRLVREVDAEWGRLYDERPYFEHGEHPPHRKDPYTRESVRVALTDVLATLRSDS